MGNIQGYVEGLHTWLKHLTLAQPGTDRHFKNGDDGDDDDTEYEPTMTNA